MGNSKSKKQKKEYIYIEGEPPPNYYEASSNKDIHEQPPPSYESIYPPIEAKHEEPPPSYESLYPRERRPNKSQLEWQAKFERARAKRRQERRIEKEKKRKRRFPWKKEINIGVTKKEWKKSFKRAVRTIK